MVVNDRFDTSMLLSEQEFTVRYWSYEEAEELSEVVGRLVVQAGEGVAVGLGMEGKGGRQGGDKLATIGHKICNQPKFRTNPVIVKINTVIFRTNQVS